MKELSKKQRELRKNWEAAKKRFDAMSLGGPRIKASVPAKKKSVADSILSVLEQNSDRLASRVN